MVTASLTALAAPLGRAFHACRILNVLGRAAVLWPPNHSMVEIVVEVAAEDICDPEPVCWILGISSNEPINDSGDGDTEPDWEYTNDPLMVLLRAERAGGGSG